MNLHSKASFSAARSAGDTKLGAREPAPNDAEALKWLGLERAAAATGTDGEQKLQNNQTVPDTAWDK
jgi:hypothetical protein